MLQQLTIFNPTDFHSLPDVKAPWVFDKPTPSGTTVELNDLMSINAIFSCVRVIAETVAVLPFELYLKTDKVIEKASDHPLYDLFRWAPNDEMTAFEFRTWLMVDANIRGCGYAQIERNSRGKPIALWPLIAQDVTPVRRDNGMLCFKYRIRSGKTSTEVVIDDADMFRIPCFVYGGLIPRAIGAILKDSFGSARASDEYSAEFFKNGGVPNGVLEIPETLSDAAYKRLKDAWAAQHIANGNRHGTVILEGGAKYNPLTPSAQETQLLEGKKFTRSEICGIFRVPPHMIADLERATFSNIEHQDLGFVKHSIRPWLTIWEQRATRILSRNDRKTHSFSHNTRDLLRGDLKTRVEAYGIMIDKGILSPNDARALEDLAPYAGGDTYFVNGTMVNVKFAAANDPAKKVATPKPSTSDSTQ